MLGLQRTMYIMRRIYRAVLPRLRDPVLDGPAITCDADDQYFVAYRTVVDDCYPNASVFVRARYAEGQRWRTVFMHYAESGRILDVGAGDGAVELAFSADERWTSVSVENVWNDTFRHLRDATGASVRRVVADAARLPFRDGCFAAVTCLETVEHLHKPALVADEIARITRPGGMLLITTPPRFRYAFRRDPHFDIPGLLLLPMRMQRMIASILGYTRPDHHVDKIYTSIAQLRRLFCRF